MNGNQPSGVEIEYTTLRQEMLGRISARQQMISITLTLAGAFLGLGWGGGSVVLMIYPVIALLLAAGWAQNEVKLRMLSSYIRDNLEPKIGGLGWEQYSRQKEGAGWSLEALSASGIFLLTQLMALGLGFYQFTTRGFPAASIEWILFVLDLVAIGALVWLASYVREWAK